MNRTPTLSIVIPVFEAGQALETLYDRLIKTLTGLRCPFEIIFVDDGGRGQSWIFIEKLATQDDRVRGIRLGRNYGQHNALLCGIRAARFEIIVTMDDDLQHPPEELPKMLALLLESDQDVVYGTSKHPQHGAMRNLATLITKIALRTVMDRETVRHVSAFRVFRSEVATSFRNYDGPFVSIDVLLTWGTSRFAGLYVRHERRQKGTSGYTPQKLISHTLNLVTGLTPLPLRLASGIGLALSFVGFALICYVLILYFVRGATVPGFPFLASVISLFSGAQLFAIGIIGEYLSRMHFRTMGMPSYVVRADTGISPKDTGVDGRSEDMPKALVE
jgi:undecaprenyl-phosphate 4-deoxy-4-formamido-L-arabinose transferase